VVRVLPVVGIPMQYHESARMFLQVRPTLGFQVMKRASEKKPNEDAIVAQSRLLGLNQ